MKFTLYTANCTGNEKNILYPNQKVITSEADLKKAVVYDHVCAQYENFARSDANFLLSDVVPMDCDNDHSDDPKDWITQEKLASFLSDVAFAVTYSRHHMLTKGNKSARPRFHVFFPTAPCKDATMHKAVKNQIHKELPFFDGNALDAAKPLVLHNPEALDSNPMLLNTPGGSYYLPDGLNGWKPTDPADLLTKVTAVVPSDEGDDLWNDALQLFFCGDQSLIDYVQMICGLCIVGKVYMEAMIIAYGDGRNGKSTFWNVIYKILGSYSGNISADALTVNCKRNVKPEMAELKGKRMIIAAELQEGMRLNTSVVKQLCSTDPIFAEKKFKAPFHFEPSHTLVLYTNHLPKVGASDDGTWRRLIVIPFHAKIQGSKDIKNYTQHLVDNAGGAVLSWLIEGARKVIAANYQIARPQCVLDAIGSYREGNDWLGNFINECCIVNKSYQEKSGELYNNYREYCIENGEYIRSTSDFYADLEQAGYKRKKMRDGKYIIGIQLTYGILD